MQDFIEITMLFFKSWDPCNMSRLPYTMKNVWSP